MSLPHVPQALAENEEIIERKIRLPRWMMTQVEAMVMLMTSDANAEDHGARPICVGTTVAILNVPRRNPSKDDGGAGMTAVMPRMLTNSACVDEPAHGGSSAENVQWHATMCGVLAKMPRLRVDMMIAQHPPARDALNLMYDQGRRMLSPKSLGRNIVSGMSIDEVQRKMNGEHDQEGEEGREGQASQQ